MVSGNIVTKKNAVSAIAKQWNKLTDKELAFIYNHLTLKMYSKDETIFKELQSTYQVFFLVTGKVKICKESPYGNNLILRVLKPSTFFGYYAYFADEEYETRSVAMENSVVASLPMSVVMRLVKENSDVALYFINQLSKLLGVSDKRILSLTQKHLRGRLAESLISLKDKYGFEADGNTLDVSMSREDLANMSSMTTSNAIRTLSSFAQEDLIELSGRKIKFLKEEELKKISQRG